ncbi:MAG: hypothetical protein KDC48_19470, partial [Planctomycetes bacterium]|nr:hypothetical protein [Planctomycetota bacterium]
LDRRWNERAARVNALLEAAALPLRVAGLASIWTVTYPQPGRYHWMLQFYLRRAGLWLQWVGSGRLVFCHTLSDEDFDVFCERFLAAAEAMRADGWWWRDEAVDARTIRKQVTRELLAAWLGEPRPLLRGGGPSPRPSAWFHLPD